MGLRLSRREREASQSEGRDRPHGNTVELVSLEVNNRVLFRLRFSRQRHVEDVEAVGLSRERRRTAADSTESRPGAPRQGSSRRRRSAPLLDRSDEANDASSSAVCEEPMTSPTASSRGPPLQYPPKARISDIEPPSSDSWDWPLSRQERKARLTMIDRQMLMMEQRDLEEKLEHMASVAEASAVAPGDPALLGCSDHR
eukprot:gnl/TRDRNA2_/TRDRNA2_86162_c0_seq2.p1 gnl/TRDRNA2_/TRDRNA2_86162_c0~~gnl/TRDRNA2_/TRDRNA2_86162_c0_seq2.p1  ORF type:complete len:199 (-),score=39.61 gnl/TRDRNA2_/TRDRNA2_86162_c0_seq2:79-675(-)